MPRQPPPVAIIGQGTLGTLLACAFSAAGREVTVVSRRVEAPGERALVVTGGPELRERVRMEPALTEERFEVLVLATRAGEALVQARQAAPHLTDEGVLVPVQNGLVPLDVAEALDDVQVAPMTVGFNARMEAAQGARVTSPGGLTVGALDPGGAPVVARMTGDLQRSIRTKITGNPQGAVWSKWTISCAINGLAVVSGSGVAELTGSKVGRQALLGVLTECVALAQDQGVALERVAGPLTPSTLAGQDQGLGGWLRHLLLRVMGRRYAGVVPSSLHALEQGRDPELDQLNGRAVTLAEQAGRPAAWNRAVLTLGQEISQGKREPGEPGLARVVDLAQDR